MLSRPSGRALDNASQAKPPAKVRAVILARFPNSRLWLTSLQALLLPSGQPFDFDLVLKATDWDEHSTSRALDELWQRRVIDASSDGYDFTHDLLREVAYNELSPVRKRFLHRRIARALEDTHKGDLEAAAGRIAAHYAAAAMAEDAIRFHRIAANAAVSAMPIGTPRANSVGRSTLRELADSPPGGDKSSNCI